MVYIYIYVYISHTETNMQKTPRKIWTMIIFFRVERNLFIVWQIGHMENTWGTQNQASDAGLVDADGEGLDANSVKTEQSGTE